MTLSEKRERLQALVSRINELSNSADESAAVELSGALDEAEALRNDINARDRAAEFTASAAAPAPKLVKREIPTAAPARPTKGFANLGEFFQAVYKADRHGQTDQRLFMNTAGDIVKESDNASGGYALPVDKRQLEVLLNPAGSLHSLCEQLTTISNAVTLPTDEDPDWSAVMQAADVAEGDALVEQKPGLTTRTLTLVKRGVLVKVTGEMLEDVSSVEQYILDKTSRKLSYYLSAVALAAFKASPAKVTVAKTTGAAAGSAADLANIQKMWVSMLPEHRAEAVWVMNPLMETVLQNLVIPATSGAIFPVYLPAGGISNAPFATLYGRPVIYFEGAAAIGTEGDIMLVAPKQFWCVSKAGGPRSAASIHFEFTKDQVAYRSYVRMVCGSKFSGQITRADGSKAGNAVTLATRS